MSNKHLSINKRKSIIGLAFFAPAAVVLLIGFVFPLIRIILLAFTASGGSIGLNTMTGVFSDHTLLTCIKNSMIFTITSTFAHLFIGLVLASIMNIDLNPKFIKVTRSAMIIPWAISPVVVATVFRLLYHPELSVFSGFIKAVPFMSQGVLSNENCALFFVILINIWYATPFYFLLFLARLQSIPREIYEASSIDGTGFFGNLFYISLPVLKPLILTLSIYDIVASLNTFDLIWLTTMGGPGTSTEVLATYIYRTAFRGQMNFEYASAMGLVLLVTIILTCGLIWFLGNTTGDRTGELK